MLALTEVAGPISVANHRGHAVKGRNQMLLGNQLVPVTLANVCEPYRKRFGELKLLWDQRKTIMSLKLFPLAFVPKGHVKGP